MIGGVDPLTCGYAPDFIGLPPRAPRWRRLPHSPRCTRRAPAGRCRAWRRASPAARPPPPRFSAALAMARPRFPISRSSRVSRRDGGKCSARMGSPYTGGGGCSHLDLSPPRPLIGPPPVGRPSLGCAHDAPALGAELPVAQREAPAAPGLARSAQAHPPLASLPPKAGAQHAASRRRSGVGRRPTARLPGDEGRRRRLDHGRPPGRPQPLLIATGKVGWIYPV